MSILSKNASIKEQEAVTWALPCINPTNGWSSLCPWMLHPLPPWMLHVWPSCQALHGCQLPWKWFQLGKQLAVWSKHISLCFCELPTSNLGKLGKELKNWPDVFRPQDLLVGFWFLWFLSPARILMVSSHVHWRQETQTATLGFMFLTICPGSRLGAHVRSSTDGLSRTELGKLWTCCSHLIRIAPD